MIGNKKASDLQVRMEMDVLVWLERVNKESDFVGENNINKEGESKSQDVKWIPWECGLENLTRTSLVAQLVKNPPANAGDTGSIPGPGRSHMPQSN